MFPCSNPRCVTYFLDRCLVEIVKFCRSHFVPSFLRTVKILSCCTSVCILSLAKSWVVYTQHFGFFFWAFLSFPEGMLSQGKSRVPQTDRYLFFCRRSSISLQETVVHRMRFYTQFSQLWHIPLHSNSWISVPHLFLSFPGQGRRRTFFSKEL